jgi:hypothetical protein
MARNRKGSPTVAIRIAPEAWQELAEGQSRSGGCLIADGGKKQTPFTGWTVDMATIRFTDREAGKRYTYLTPPIAQHLLLAFDQGWTQPTEEIVLRRAVKIDTLTTSRPVLRQRAERKAELEAKVASGEATRVERSVLGKIAKGDALGVDKRPHSRGPAKVTGGSHGRPVTVHNGEPLVQNRNMRNPNLLRGTDRHFGAKLAEPGIAFREAVEEGVRQHLAQAEAAAAE